MDAEKIGAIVGVKAKHLPNIRPLKEFLHLNLFPGMQSLPFWKALEQCARDYGQIPFPSLAYYRHQLSLREIDRQVFESEIKANFGVSMTVDSFVQQTQYLKRKVRAAEKSSQPWHDLISEELRYSINELVEPQLMRWLAAFMDQGISFWSMPGNENKTLYQAILSTLTESFITPHPFSREQLQQMQAMTEINCLTHYLNLIIGDDEIFDAYLEESLFSMKGWAGFIHTLEQNPSLLSERRKINLIDFMALKTALEWAWIIKIKPHFARLSMGRMPHPVTKISPVEHDKFRIFTVWHEALEKSYYQKVLNDMRSFHPVNHASSPKVQLLCCIDDRVCSFRRILESANAEIETFGTPGHFGLDFIYQDSPSAYPKKHCPAPVNAQFLVREEGQYVDHDLRRMLDWIKLAKMSALAQLPHIFLEGIKLGINMLKQVFMPIDANITPIVEVELKSELHIIRTAPERNQFGLFDGYGHEEIAKRIFDVLYSIGLIKNFASMIVLLGHGSKTTNNPYFTAYGCGACSGRAGIPNARAFCQGANDPAIRKILAEKYHLLIPDTTYFQAGFHDTCQDRISLYNPSKMPSHHHELYYKLKSDLTFALKKNAELRCQQFELVPKNTLDKLAVAEAFRRSHAIFEPRPELGHTNNALCIVGKRSSVRGLSFDRRAFLQSYDAALDPDGTWLNTILSAAIPVCGGINLDYFFARINNLGLGAGSKLSQNVVGLVAVSNGVEDDLLIGLPSQMVELHTPLRIMFVIEQTTAVMESVLNKNPSLKEWIHNEWVRLATIDPTTHEMYFFQDGVLRPCQGANIC